MEELEEKQVQHLVQDHACSEELVVQRQSSCAIEEPWT
jgi:hypothetical protein